MDVERAAPRERDERVNGAHRRRAAREEDEIRSGADGLDRPKRRVGATEDAERIGDRYAAEAEAA